MPDSLVIRYDGLRRLLLKKYPADYELVIDFLDEAGKKERLRLQLKPPDKVEASARAAGVSGKTVMKNYAAEPRLPSFRPFHRQSRRELNGSSDGLATTVR